MNNTTLRGPGSTCNSPSPFPRYNSPTAKILEQKAGAIATENEKSEDLVNNSNLLTTKNLTAAQKGKKDFIEKEIVIRGQNTTEK